MHGFPDTTLLPAQEPAMDTPAQPQATTSRAPARPWRRALAWLAVLAPFFYLSYGLANHLASLRPQVPSLVFGWEQQVPFWAWTILPYWSLNAFYGLSLFLAPTRRLLDRHAARLLTAQCIAVACFIAWPLQCSFGRPAVEGPLGLLFDALRSFDAPFNQAPSLHVALVVILWDLYRRVLRAPWARALLHLWSLLIVGSVLTTWQHHAIDIPMGALLGVACVWAWPLTARVSMPAAWRFSQEPRRRQLAARYAAGALAGLALAAAGAWAGEPAGLLLLWPALALAVVALCCAGLGVRGFQIDRRGAMHWSARVLLLPYLLAARLNARLWTRGLPAARVLRPGLWLASLERLRTDPPRTPVTPPLLISLCAELPVAGAASGTSGVLCLPMLDLVPADPARLRAAASLITAAHVQGRPVVLACALGFSRSVAVAACWLVRSGRAMDAADALRQIRLMHPHATLDAGWLQAVQRASTLRPRAPGALARRQGQRAGGLSAAMAHAATTPTTLAMPTTPARPTLPALHALPARPQPGWPALPPAGWPAGALR